MRPEPRRRAAAQHSQGRSGGCAGAAVPAQQQHAVSAVNRMLRAVPGALCPPPERVLRFLAANSWNVQASVDALKRDSEWRSASLPIPRGVAGLSEQRLQELSADSSRFVLWPELNAAGQPVLQTRHGGHFHEGVTPVELLALWVHCLERAMRMIPADRPHEYVALSDVSLMGRDLPGARRPPAAFLERQQAVLAAHYPRVMVKEVVYPMSVAMGQAVLAASPWGRDAAGECAYRGPQCFVNSASELLQALGVAPTALPAAAQPLLQVRPMPEAITLLEVVRGSAAARARQSAASGADAAEGEDDDAPWSGGAPAPAAAAPLQPREPPQPREPQEASHPAAPLSPRDSSPPALLDARGAGTPGVVYTPWLPDGAAQNQLTLEEELHQFAYFMRASAPEELQRAAALEAVRGAAARCAPGCSVQPVGLAACGLLEPGAELQLAAVPAAQQSAAVVAAALAAELPHAECLGGEAEAALRFTSQEGLAVSVAVGTAAEAVRDATLYKALVADCTAVRAVLPCVRHVCGQSRLMGPAVGGLPERALLMMVLHACLLCKDAAPLARTQDADQVLYRFLLYYGQQLDPAAHSVDPCACAPIPRVHPEDPLSVLDPLRPGVNLARGCTRVVQLRMHLSYCLQSLAQWDPNCSGRKRRYKGRTPLSSIINHGPLWQRRKLLDEEYTASTGEVVDKMRAMAAPAGGGEHTVESPPGHAASRPPSLLDTSFCSGQSEGLPAAVGAVQPCI
eukprot:TRINITY_DN13879_c0_g1_i4.p1 TRINITY_DN13879_c0_g1~~TRINITY_DN13879_c0_g1_i4.p1  ORF type:complete len:740 (+),score=133.96 TRINITY_DN13879_c0_g1_i4:148-2367(+)